MRVFLFCKPYRIISTSLYRGQNAKISLCYRHCLICYYLICYFVQLGSVNIQTCWQFLSVYSALCREWPDRPSHATIPAENTSTCCVLDACVRIFPSSFLESTWMVIFKPFHFCNLTFLSENPKQDLIPFTGNWLDYEKWMLHTTMEPNQVCYSK